MKNSTLVFVVLLINIGLIAQVAINDNNSDPDPSALLDVKSTEKGLLLPRLTLPQRDAINNPAEGLVIWNTTNKTVDLYNGTSWGPLSGNFVCGSSQIEDIDGNFYSTVQIGEQCWMAENLNVGIMIQGSAHALDNDIIEKHCHSNDPANCDNYGGLYEWREAMNWDFTVGGQGICPDGWHVPSDDEWCTLETVAEGGSFPCTSDGWRGSYAGLNLKSSSGWSSGNGTDLFGFSVLPGGHKSYWGDFHYLLTDAGFNTSNSTSANYKIGRGFNYQQDGITRGSWNKNDGSGIRCLKDD